MDLLAAAARNLGFSLTPQQLDQFETYCRELAAWNQKFNLTAITGYEEVQTRHFLDSLSVSQALPRPVPPGFKILDVGAGAGFPGLPLKIALPQLSLTLLEATAKKAAFLRHIIDKLELKNVAVIAGRAEEAAHEAQHREQYDAVMSRAVAELPALLELTLPFCHPGGMVIAQKKGDIDMEIAQSAKALKMLGGEISEIIKILLPGLSDGRCLLIIQKISITPDAYPRRAGMPARRPLV